MVRLNQLWITSAAGETGIPAIEKCWIEKISNKKYLLNIEEEVFTELYNLAEEIKKNDTFFDKVFREF